MATKTPAGALGALAHAESFVGDDAPPPSNAAAEICAAVEAVDADMAAMAFSELPKEDNYESDEDEDEGLTEVGKEYRKLMSKDEKEKESDEFDDFFKGKTNKDDG